MSLNSYNLTKQSIVYGMFNQYVFNEVKTNIDLIERYFLMDVTTMGNNLIKSLLDAVRKYEFSSIDEPLFRSILASQGKTDSESNSILQEIVRYKMCDTYQIDPIRKFIRGIGNQSLIDIASKRFANDPEGYIKYLRTNEYKADYSDMFVVTNFDQLDINSVMADSMGGWKSTYEFINDSFQPMQKYENGQIVCVYAPPGTGKSLFLQSECLGMCLQGARCHYLALGDMNQKDFVQRMCAMYSGYSFGDVILNLNESYSRLKSALSGRFSLTIVPAATVTVDEYIEYMISKSDSFDVLFVDYDSNFRSTQADNMYKEGGYIYDNLTKLTKMGKLVFCASQPKIGSWKCDVLELTDIGESSRKQHNVDCAISISKGGMSYNPNHLGRMKITKNRRGEEGVEVPYIRLNNGRFRILTESLYSKLKGITERRNYTDSDINQMIEAEKQQAAMNNPSNPNQSQSQVVNPLQQYFTNP